MTTRLTLVILRASPVRRLYQTLDVKEAGLAAATPILQKSDPKASLVGVANGSLKLKARGLKQASATGEFTVDNFAYTASAIPEPSTYATVMAALVLAGVVWRRNSSKRA